MKKDFLASWRTNFFTGLAIVLPAVVSVAVIFWFFFTVSNITDTLLVFIPREMTHENGGTGPMFWYWKLVALIMAIVLTASVGRLARNFLGKKVIEWVDTSLLRIPLLNKLYGTTKQVNEALTSGSKGSFKTVVMVEFPRAGSYSLGFITGEQLGEIERKSGQKMVAVFIPTTPNPTSGFLVLFPENQVTRLDMSVAQGIKFIISLGAISPDNIPAIDRKAEADR